MLAFVLQIINITAEYLENHALILSRYWNVFFLPSTQLLVPIHFCTVCITDT